MSLGGEPLAALFPAGRENAPAVLGRHARQEAVYSLAPPIMGLERPLHDHSSELSLDYAPRRYARDDNRGTACDYTGLASPRSSSGPEMRAFRRLSTPVNNAVENVSAYF